MTLQKEKCDQVKYQSAMFLANVLVYFDLRDAIKTGVTNFLLVLPKLGVSPHIVDRIAKQMIYSEKDQTGELGT
jgi:hypothetical protein